LLLRAVEHWQPALRGTANENPFRELMARSHETGRSRLVNLVHGKRWSVAAERDFAPSYLMRKKRVVFAKPRRANVSSKLMLHT
jgi:hypothetical protein